MPGLRVAYMYGRFLIGLRGYLRHTITLAQARDLVKERLTRRTESLLLMAERSVFGLRTSPYRELLRLAGCELGDFVALVNDRGVEGALLALRKSGVYFTFEEFKGREPVVRDGREIPITPVSSITHTFPGTSGPELVARQAKQRASPLTWIILQWGRNTASSALTRTVSWTSRTQSGGRRCLPEAE